MGLETKSLGIDLATNKTTTSTSYVAVAGSGFNHTFTKPNALIRVSDMIVNGATGETVTIKLDLASLSPVNIQEARVSGSIVRTMSCAHVYEGIPAGSRAISLVWKVSGGTGTMNASAYLHYEIIEYD